MNDFLSVFQKKRSLVFNILYLFFGLIASMLAFSALIGWISGNVLLTSLNEGLVPMAASTSILFAILLGAYFLTLSVKKKPGFRTVILTSAYIVFILSLLMFVSSFLDIHPAFTSLDFSTNSPESQAPVGHMSPVTTLLLAMIGFIIILLVSARRNLFVRTIPTVLSGTVMTISGILLISYILGQPLLYNTNIFPVALNTAIALFAIGSGLLIAVRTPGFCEIDAAENQNLRPLNRYPVIISVIVSAILLFGYLNIQTVFKNIHDETKNRLILINDLKSHELAGLDLSNPDPDRIKALLEWPIESSSGANILAGYSGDSLYVYQVMQGYSGRNMELMINPDTLPGSLLANGINSRNGFIKGISSNGDNLVAFVSEVPGTSWIIISFISEETAYKPLVKQLIQMTILVFFLLTFAVAMLMLVARQSKIRSYQEQIEATRILQEQLIRSNNEAQQSNRLKDAFLANISHEIRTPLNAIIGFAGLMRDHIAPSNIPEYNNYFEIIKNSSDRLTRTIEMILNVSRLQIGDYDLRPVELLLDQKIRDLIAEYSPAAAQKGIGIHFINTAGNSVIVADEYCIVHSISNLIDNAVKYTPQGEITVTLFRNSDDRISLDVSDTGIGISEEFISEIFRPFSQEDSGTTRRFEGVGLALSVTQRLLAAINATISVRSNKGQGTTFTITFLS